MDPIEMMAPDGSIVEFPAGTDDATIEAAMAEAFPANTPTAPQPRQAATPPTRVDPNSQDSNQPLAIDAAGNVATERTYEGLTPEQVAVYQSGIESGEIDPRGGVGTNQLPIFVREGASDQEIQDLIARGVTFVDREGRTQRKADDLYGLYVGAARPAINTMNWLENGIRGAAGEGAGDAFHDWRAENTKHATQEGFDELEGQAIAAGRRPGRAGQVAGSVAATAPLALATRNPWLLGAAEGALTSTADDAMGLARDTAIGAVVSKGGDVVTRGLGAGINPQINPATRRLVEEGVEVSPGQLVGGLAHRTEDAMTGIPALGEIPNAAQRRAQESVARVAVQRPMTAIGVELPTNLRSTHDAIDFAQRAASDAYGDLIPHLDLRLDPDFATNFRSLDAAVRNMQPDQVHQWEQLIRNEVMPRFNAAQGTANGRITGESFKELEGILGREVRDFTRGNASPHDHRYASAVRELQAELRDMLARNNPAQAERLQSINDAYRQLTVLESAANMAPAGSRGRFSPHQLEQAARQADPTVRRRAAARGDALFQDLAEDAGEVMSRTVNDSGTATRGALTAGLGAAFLGKTIGISVNPWAVGALAFGAIPYNRTGNRLLTAAMTQRPEFAAQLRNIVDGSAWMAGLTAAANNSVDRNENRAESAEANVNADERQRWEALQAGMEQTGQAQEAVPLDFNQSGGEDFDFSDMEGLY